MKLASLIFGAFALFLCLGQSVAMADPNGDPAAVKQDPATGVWNDKAGNPTFKVEKDGTVDWYTSVGYLQYGANCLVCHGPDALGSSYAPNLTDSLKSLSYAEVYGIIVGGKRNVSASQDLVMPAWGNNKNVMCHINAIYVYLRARSDGAVGRGRPSKVAPKPAGFDKAEDACFGN